LQFHSQITKIIDGALEDDVKAHLKRRAARAQDGRRSLAHFAQRGEKQDQRPPKLGSRIAARFAKAGLTADLPELHGQFPRALAPSDRPDLGAFILPSNPLRAATVMSTAIIGGDDQRRSMRGFSVLAVCALAPDGRLVLEIVVGLFILDSHRQRAKTS
jgi:hypothetical protein